MGPGFRSDPTFYKIDKNLHCISIFSQCFQEVTKNAGEMLFSIFSQCFQEATKNAGETLFSFTIIAYVTICFQHLFRKLIKK